MHDLILNPFVISAGIVFAAFVMVTGFVRAFRKAGPHEALVVYGVRGKRVITGGGAVIWPLVETYRTLSLELMSFDVAPQQSLYTRQGVAVTVEAVAQIKVKADPESIRTAAEQFLTKPQTEREALIRLVMEGHLRGIGAPSSPRAASLRRAPALVKTISPTPSLGMPTVTRATVPTRR